MSIKEIITTFKAQLPKALDEIISEMSTKIVDTAEKISLDDEIIEETLLENLRPEMIEHVSKKLKSIFKENINSFFIEKTLNNTLKSSSKYSKNEWNRDSLKDNAVETFKDKFINELNTSLDKNMDKNLKDSISLMLKRYKFNSLIEEEDLDEIKSFYEDTYDKYITAYVRDILQSCFEKTFPDVITQSIYVDPR